MTTATKPEVVARRQTVACPGVADDHCGKKIVQLQYLWDGPWSPTRCPECTAKLQEMRSGDAVRVERSLEVSAREQRLRKLRVPPKYRSATLDNFVTHGPPADQAKQRSRLAFARRFVQAWPARLGDPDVRFPYIVLLMGVPGSGKGHLEWAIAKAIVEAHAIDAAFVKCYALVMDLRQSWGNSDGEREGERLKYWQQLGLLIIDEVSRHALSVDPQAHLMQLIDHRDDWHLPTILSTNEGPEAFAELLGAPLVDRAKRWKAVLDCGSSSYRAVLAERDDLGW